MTLVDFVDSIVAVVHVLFAGAWAGGTLFMAGAVLPAAREGHLSRDGLAWVARRFTFLSIASVVALLLTGGHLAGTRYTFETLASSGRGHLVLTMVALWFVLAGLLHVASHRLTGRLDDGPAEAVEASAAWFYASSVVAVALLVVAGLL